MNSNWVQVGFWAVGYSYCFYTILFRWKALRQKYGTVDLFWWFATVMFAVAIAGYLAALAVWKIQVAISN